MILSKRMLKDKIMLTNQKAIKNAKYNGDSSSMVIATLVFAILAILAAIAFTPASTSSSSGVAAKTVRVVTMPSPVLFKTARR